MLAAETLSAQRLADVLALGRAPVLAITARRAETLKARAYDGDLARVFCPDATPAWVQSIADPADDLRAPMKGPLALRDGRRCWRTAPRCSCANRRGCCRPLLVLPMPQRICRQHGLTTVDWTAAVRMLARSPLHPVVSARLPMEVSEAGRLHIFRPEDGGEEHYAIEIGGPTAQTRAGPPAFGLFHR